MTYFHISPPPEKPSEAVPESMLDLMYDAVDTAVQKLWAENEEKIAIVKALFQKYVYDDVPIQEGNCSATLLKLRKIYINDGDFYKISPTVLKNFQNCMHAKANQLFSDKARDEERIEAIVQKRVAEMLAKQNKLSEPAAKPKLSFNLTRNF